jgi:DNA-3-methyladenine glycosylase I
MPARRDLTFDDDGRARCGWVGDDPEYRRYHDEEWGRVLRGDRPLFEKLSLEAFQSGLSWITILRRRDGFRRAFAGFDPEAVAAFTDHDVERLMADTGIIRNRAKIEATMANAKVIAPWVREEPGALDALIWAHAPARRRERPRLLADMPSTSPESVALAHALKARGLRFVGPTTVYALMQSSGLVDDHLAGCWRSGY